MDTDAPMPKEISQSDLFERLLAIDKAVAQRFPDPPGLSSGLGCLGLGLCEPKERGGYWCTPRNTRAFAWTGGEGVHFSFLVLRRTFAFVPSTCTPIKEGPVVMTRPSNIEDAQNIVVGEDLYEFLRLGSRCGYSLLEYIDDESPDVNDRLYDILIADVGAWHDPEEGKAIAMHSQRVLDYLCSQLNLNPWPDVRVRLDQLRQGYLSHLKGV